MAPGMDARAVVPEDLRRRSWSDRELILSYDDAVLAMDALAAHGVDEVAWEGLIGQPDGRYGGTPGGVIGTSDFFSWQECMDTMTDERGLWPDRLDEGETLLFCLSIRPAPGEGYR